MWCSLVLMQQGSVFSPTNQTPVYLDAQRANKTLDPGRPSGRTSPRRSCRGARFTQATACIAPSRSREHVQHEGSPDVDHQNLHLTEVRHCCQ